MANFVVEDIKRVFRGGGNILSQIIVINAVVFIVFNIIENFYPITVWFALPGNFLKFLVKFWTIITYMFLHAGFFHILFNMLWLYWLGRILLEYLGSKKFTAAYFLGGIAGGLLFLLINTVIETSSGGSLGVGLVGASAAVMAVVFAVATLLPNYTVHLFLLGPVRMKYLALGALIITSVLDFSVNTGGKIAHFGGAAFGYFYVKQLQNGRDWSVPFYSFVNFFKGLFKSKSKMKVTHRNTGKTTGKSSSASKADQEVIDRILDKISKSGYDSLTKQEKEILFKMSNDNN